MTKIFNESAKYYDLFYADKDYSSEVNFAHQIVQKYKPGAAKLLEFGCGTGVHAEFLAKHNYCVHGVDISAEMIERANARKKNLAPVYQNRLSFENSDLINFTPTEKVDAVLSLFHVMCYLTTNEKINEAFARARESLNVGGIFFFDFWYGPAVLHQKPTDRMKKIQDDKFTAYRFAQSNLEENNNVVTVKYHYVGSEAGTGILNEFDEEHRVRYYFRPELEMIGRLNGFAPVAIGEWMTEANPSLETWGVYFVFKAE